MSREGTDTPGGARETGLCARRHKVQRINASFDPGHEGRDPCSGVVAGRRAQLSAMVRQGNSPVVTEDPGSASAQTSSGSIPATQRPTTRRPSNRPIAVAYGREWLTVRIDSPGS